MNKIRIISILIVCSFISCKTTQETIEITQEVIEYPVILRLSKKYKKIIGIKFPKKIKIKNNSIKRRSFIKIDYEYNNIPPERKYGIGLFKEIENDLKKISNNKRKEIAPYNSRQYILYTRHFVDSISSIQNNLKPYINEMLKLKQDTLAIGTVSEFKNMHNKLLNELTENDSISIQFLDGKELGERIAVPIEW